MTVRFHTKGRDPLVVPRTTAWQRERAGPILPMHQPRRWWQVWRRR